MNSVVKKSLGAPFRQLSSCVSGDKDGFSRKGKTVRRKSAPCCYSQTAHDSSWLRTYQAELHRERKQRQAKFAQKNAERTAIRAHYRSPHRFTKAPVQSANLKSKTPTKSDNSFFGAFRGLSLSMNGAQASITSPSNADPFRYLR
uniref:Si:ch211-81a5.8 n=1 Tax=Sinocyclocheilus rhinocerous TaxID=307959 RepID=A0A673FWI8_9TELE